MQVRVNNIPNDRPGVIHAIPSIVNAMLYEEKFQGQNSGTFSWKALDVNFLGPKGQDRHYFHAKWERLGKLLIITVRDYGLEKDPDKIEEFLKSQEPKGNPAETALIDAGKKLPKTSSRIRMPKVKPPKPEITA